MVTATVNSSKRRKKRKWKTSWSWFVMSFYLLGSVDFSFGNASKRERRLPNKFEALLLSRGSKRKKERKTAARIILC